MRLHNHFITSTIVLLSLPILVSAQQASLVWSENNALQNNYILLSHLSSKSSETASASKSDITWIDPTRIHSSGNTLTTPSYTQNNEYKMVVWSEVINKKPALFYSYSTNGPDWSQPKLLSNNGENLGSTLITARDGSIWAFWSSDRNGLDDIFSSTWSGGFWSSPTVIHSKNDVPDVLPKVNIDNNGDIVVSWKTYSSKVSRYVEKAVVIKQNLRIQNTQASHNKQDILLQELAPIPFDISQSRAYIHVPENQYQQSYTFFQQ